LRTLPTLPTGSRADPDGSPGSGLAPGARGDYNRAAPEAAGARGPGMRGRGKSELLMGARWVTPSRGNARESATENTPPGDRRRARVKRWGKSPPPDRRRSGHGKPRAEQGQIGGSTGPITGSPPKRGGSPGRPLEPAGDGPVRGMGAVLLRQGTEFGLSLPLVPRGTLIGFPGFFPGRWLATARMMQ
jgi:hypothetical protein